MAKEEKNRFQLNKGTDHGFDISKGGKRNFDLTKNADEPVVTSTKSEPAAKPVGVAPKPEGKSNKKWLWIIAIIIIAILAWLLWPSSTVHVVVEEETVEEATSSTDKTTDEATDEKTTSDVQNEADAQDEDVNADVETAPATTPTSPMTTPMAITSVSNDIEAEALKVIRGDYGVGQERKDKLGARYQSIQKRVNELKSEGAF